MAKDKLNNLLSFDQYSDLKKFNKPTKRTEIGGDVVNERKKGGCSCGEPIKKKSKNNFMLEKKPKHIKEFAEYTNEEIGWSDVKKGVRDVGNYLVGKISREDALQVIDEWKIQRPRKYDAVVTQSIKDGIDQERLIKCIMENPEMTQYIVYDPNRKVFFVTASSATTTGVGAGVSFKSNRQKTW